MIYFFVSLTVVFSGAWIFTSTREHLLSTLLSLEFMVLGIFFYMLFSFSGSSYYYSLFYLILTACEGALGLSVLVMMSRSHGGDYFKLMSFYS